MSVQAGPTEKRYAANGVSTAYTIPFLLLDAGDLQVYLNGTLVTSGFTLTGVTNPTSTITFAVAPAGDLYLVLNVPFQRLVDYQENGDFLATTVNRDYDRIWQALKQLFRGATRALTLGAYDIDGSGFYRAKGNGISDLRDPINNQDAVTKGWILAFIESVSGAINTTVGISYDSGTLYDFLKSGNYRAVNSIAALRALSSSRNQRAVTLGYYAAGDGGGSAYYIDATDTTTADNGGTVIVGADGGRWKMVATGVVSVLQFGAKGDGATNDNAAFQAALTASKIVRVPYKAATYVLTGVILLPNNSLLGDPWTKIKHTGGGPLFTLRGSQITISDFDIDSRASVNGSRIFLLDTANAAMEYLNISRIKCDSAWVLLSDSGTPNVVTNVHISYVSCRNHRGPGVSVSRMFAFSFFSRVTLDYISNTANANAAAFSFANAQGLIMEDCDVLGTLTTTGSPQQYAFNFDTCAAVWLNRLDADSAGGYGFRFNNVGYLYAINCQAAGCGDHAMLANQVSIMKLTNCTMLGKNDLGGAANLHGFYVLGVSDHITITGCTAKFCTGNGFVLSACNRANIAGSNSHNNTGRGLVTSGASVSLTSGMQFDGNAGGNYSLATANDLLVASQAASGALINATGPASA